ncbi:NADAR family protein [Lapillicoccus jejuensis]|uniref:Putative NAD-dependent protein-ADP-ribosyltransferase YbiA (DUF1768 family) n=1 Tax=Lapillicoccus jejuensis TaxID=402171 RepID=A0A542E322_9MICO|nr:NADAR family protein [Lapillicoccus jejuensis]TQJ09727.1 putative NAD-dependent protein-ADP-ribosyltransferase YbiA (DUF1768 family) [Lapillicoccus jejuensis]
MAMWSRTSRDVDGESVIGSWRHAFINNGGSYYLTDLIVYADGLVDCWGLVTVEQFRDKLRSGWVATSLKEGAEASAHELASWTFKNVQSWVGADELYREVVDQIETLNGRLDSAGRCLEALDLFLAEQTDANRQRLAGAYDDIPEHRRRYILGDMDAKDWPLQVLITPLGKKLAGQSVTEERRETALAYFAEWRAGRDEAAERTPTVAPAVVVPGSFHHNGWPDPPGILGLHTQYPAPVRIGDVLYPTVEHAYWALRTTDRAVQDAVLAEPNTYRLSQIASGIPARPGWDASLQATIAHLLRAKFQQHEALALELLATGEGRIVFNAAGFGDTYAYNSRRHLIGRLLELVRAEQQAWRAGLLDLGALDQSETPNFVVYEE